MGQVILFAQPKPVRPMFPAAVRSESDVFSLIAAKLDADVLEQAAAVAVVFGMPELARMNADEALAELSELVKRTDVCAVLDAHNQRQAAIKRRQRQARL